MKAIFQKLFTLLILLGLVVVIIRESRTMTGGGELPGDQSAKMFADLGAAAAGGPDVLMFVTSWCPICTALEKDLDARGVPYLKADIEQNRLAMLYYNRLTNGRGGGVPLTVVGTKIYRGYNLKAILSEVLRLHQQRMTVAPAEVTSAPAAVSPEV